MAFRKRNIGIGGSARGEDQPSTNKAQTPTHNVPGVRPSPLTGQATTSTGTWSLDNLLGGHAGLPLGSLLLIEESGTTDFAGALLRFYAAEGIVQNQSVHVVGVGEQWTKELPGMIGAADSSTDAKQSSRVKVDEEKMKIAWRYERLGQHDASRPGRVTPNREVPTSTESRTAADDTPAAFCHAFDLAKRLTIPPSASIHHISISLAASASASPFSNVLQSLTKSLQQSAPTAIHRLVIPTILSPALYPPSAGHPHHLLQFLHSLRSLLRQHPTRLTVMATLPSELYPRSTGLVRWAEHLADGVIELTPFPHLMDASTSLAESGGARAVEDQPQGMLKFHKIPVTTERGGGGSGSGIGDDLAFTLSRRKFVIRPFSLPPMEGDTDAQQGAPSGEGALGKATKVDIEF
ncbi:hypothetical protein MBLNU457_1162t1 [Dothideomycetes sp. NU457]